MAIVYNDSSVFSSSPVAINVQYDMQAADEYGRLFIASGRDDIADAGERLDSHLSLMLVDTYGSSEDIDDFFEMLRIVGEHDPALAQQYFQQAYDMLMSQYKDLHTAYTFGLERPDSFSFEGRGFDQARSREIALENFERKLQGIASSEFFNSRATRRSSHCR